MTLQNLANEELAKLLREGRADILLEIIRRHRPKLYAITRRITTNHEDAEDAVQETFIQALKKIEQWHGDNFSGWLERIARNKAIDYIRKRKTISISKETEQQGPQEILLSMEKCRVVRDIVERLPEGQKAIVQLKHFQGHTIREIAEIRQCAQGTVKASLFQSLQKLKKEFQAAGIME